MNRLKKIIGSIFIGILLTNCATSEKPKNFDYGEITANVYSNNFFNFKIKIPTDWVILKQSQQTSLLEKGNNVPREEETVKASEINMANLLNVFQYEIGSEVNFNPSIIIYAENNNNKPEIIRTGDEYLNQAKKALMQTQLRYEYISEKTEKEIIDNTHFYKIETHTLTAKDSIKQRYYATVINGFSLLIIITYTTEEQEKILLEAIHSIKM